MNHNNQKRQTPDYAVLERRHRIQIIGGLRDTGLSYSEIRQLLGVALWKIERCLGEAARLRSDGFSNGEIAAELGVAAGSMGRILPGPRTSTVTERQAEVLAGLAHMHGMQIDVLAEFLNVYESSAYAIVKALAGQGLVAVAKVQRGRAWAYPKTRDVAGRYLGWRPGEWEPPLMYANHYRAVAQARVMLVGADPAAWVSERVLHHEARRAARAEAEARHGKPVLEFSTGRQPIEGRPHIHDGWFHGVVDGQFGWWALEVELTPKDPKHLDTAVAGAFRSAGNSSPQRLIGVLYLCRTERVLQAVEAAKQRLPAELATLPLEFAVGDFDEDWAEFLKARRAVRAAKAEANRKRRTVIQLSKEAS
ncbi:hypothetical protein IU500_34395 [Nocardia terpenica]|uniref:hypothetical protein n=1 Tax=Nocardia terpenica TaxID=455432 RepID=UPI001895B5FE|nr:hypothetical protein [Nocardia terpenica]MBF6065425.1 hypothetical protein [Nocardia terpenica]MBF6109107.1 hypothetical protein [Nocardia terpenica]MBF6114691.1 hypothetical protein [Nocardia terpenica]MBF6123376.1 hypothetical protein [Nocardia terpenica]MBF6156606.1 hypothetical protein [Nocardia terpenica]